MRMTAQRALARALPIALSLSLLLPACGETPTPDSSATSAATPPAPPPTGTASATTTSQAAPTAEPIKTAEPANTATTEPTVAPTATATATAVTSSKPKPKPKPTAITSAAPTTAPAPSEGPTAAPITSAPVEIKPPVEGSADAIAQKMDGVFVPSKKNFFAKFKQKLEQKVSGTKKESTGTLNVERPNKISFRYDPPNKNRVVADGTTLKAYIADDNQMFESKVDSSAYAGGLAFFMGGLLKTMSFSFNTKVDYKDGYVLIGKPRSPSPTYDFVMFYVNKALLEKGEAGCIERIVIVDAQGNKNRYDFTEASFPESVAKTEWEFTPPAGTNITKN